MTHSNKTIGALTDRQRRKIEEELFEGAGQALQAIRGWARYHVLPPVASVIVSALHTLSAVPAGTTYDAGLGAGSLNAFVTLVGAPGEGKDKLAAAIARDLVITCDGSQVKPIRAALGSGEGIVSNCSGEVTADGNRVPAKAYLYEESEAGKLESLMNRQGSTLRSTLLSMYSGGPLGATNKNDSSYVESNSYTAGLLLGVQPDKSGVLLGGHDDGFSHRFIWSDLLDPNAADDWAPVDLTPVVLPADIDKGIIFPESVRVATRSVQVTTRIHGATANGQGHRNQTRLKLAAGLALLRSSRMVSMEDWERSGVLMDYSEHVRSWCLRHVESQYVLEDAKRLERREQAENTVEDRREIRCRKKILDALSDDESQEPVLWSGKGGLTQKVHSRDRGALNTALNNLIHEGAVTPYPDDGNSIECLVIGPNFDALLSSTS